MKTGKQGGRKSDALAIVAGIGAIALGILLWVAQHSATAIDAGWLLAATAAVAGAVLIVAELTSGPRR